MPEREIAENRFIFTDLHLGEDKNNNLEYFEADFEFSRAVGLITEQYAGEEATLCFLGDTFDFLAVEYNGKTHAEATEDAAIEKIRKIFAAHPKAIEAMRFFLSRGGRIKFFIGNHDLALAWANVRNFICRELTKGWAWHYDPDPLKCFWYDSVNAWKRIEFLFHEKKNGVYFIHGNNTELLHSTPKNVFFTKRLGQPLILPLLRHPYGSHSRADLANALARGSRFRKGNYWVGRLEPHWYVYLEALWRNWWFAVCAIFLWLIMPIRHRLSRRWWVRKSAGIITLFRLNLELMLWTLWNTVRGIDHTHYPKMILRDNDDIDVIFLGHIHTCQRETHGIHGTFIYPGNWSTTYDAHWPKPELNWRRLRRLERVVKNIATVRKMFSKKTRAEFAPRRREIYSFGVCRFFSDGHKEVDIWRYNPEKDCIEELN
jgi:UDP-2,3-diacylglucosamine pyrophosphatase LpxH